MEKQVIYKDPGLTASALVKGKIYQARDGRVVLYIGRNPKGKYVFYLFGAAALIMDWDDNSNRLFTYANEKVQVEGLCRIIDMSMSSKGCRDSVMQYRKIPGICGEFPHPGFSNVNRWYRQNFADDEKMPRIIEGKVQYDYVSAKDLIPGHLYYADTGYPYIFIYLGRTSIGQFLWFPVRNVVMPYKETLINYSVTTRSNRKVRPLEAARNDPDMNNGQYFCSVVVQDLLERGITAVDMSGITQEMLDSNGLL